MPPYEPFSLGVGVVFNILTSLKLRELKEVQESSSWHCATTCRCELSKQGLLPASARSREMWTMTMKHMYIRYLSVQKSSHFYTFISDFSSRPWRNLPPTWVIHMATRQTSPQHADPHGFLVWFSFKSPQVHVDRRVVGWSAGRHVDHPCGWQISPWPATRNVTEFNKLENSSFL